ncbi:MAG: PKD domain-containing protein [Planctomycetota bacterium]
MERQQRSLIGPTGLIAMVVLLATASPSLGWWNFKWSYRRKVTVAEYEPTGLPGDDIAAVTMSTAGLSKPDGSDIRVLTGRGMVIPHRVLMVGPGDQIRIAFAIRPSAKTYHVYFGCDDPPDDAKPLTIQRGVLQESWAYTGGKFDTLAQVEEIFLKDAALIGRGFRGRIFQGHNPFGPQERLATTFTAWFIAAEAGLYTFCTSSRNASFLLIDGKPVVANGGSHAPQTDVTKQGEIELTAGVHQLQFHHVSPGGDPVVVAAWRPPGGKRIWPMAPGAFAPVLAAQAGPLEQYSRTVTVDILATHAGEAFLNGRYYQRYEFEAHAAGGPGRNVEWEWSFGDGTSGHGQRVEHVYLTPGEHTVTLSAKTRAGVLTRSMRLMVWRPWDLVTQNKLDRLSQHAHIVGRYELTALEAEATAEAIVLLDWADNVPGVLRLGEALLTKPSVSAAALRRAVWVHADALLAADRPAEAAAALAKAAEMTDDAGVGSAALARAGRITLDELDDADKAAAAFQAVIDRWGQRAKLPGVRQAWLGTGDVWRRRGDRDKSASAYEKAAPEHKERTGEAAFRSGDFARHVEFYLRSNDLPAAQAYLDRWAERYPADKLGGYWSLLTVRVRMLEKDYAAAAREAAVLVGVNPTSVQGPELLMLAANAHHRLGENEKVSQVLRQIIDLYPESPLAAEAADKLKRP